MEEIKDSELNIDEIKQHQAEYFLPNQFNYPKQILENNLGKLDYNAKLNNSKLSSYNSFNNKFTNTQSNLKNIDTEEIKNSLPLRLNNDEAITIEIMKNSVLNDISIGLDNLIFICGMKIVKVLYYDVITQGEILLFCLIDKEEVFNSISYSNVFQILQQTINSNKLCEYFYSSDVINDKKCFLFATGGDRFVIRVFIGIYIESKQIFKFSKWTLLVGHTNEIYDLKFHPLEPQILLSSGKDFSIRLWNALKRTQIAIFSGPLGHQADILSIDFHMSGEYFVSSGVDCYIKIWEITSTTKERINDTLNNNFEYDLSENQLKKQSSKILINESVIFSSNQVHDKYVDCVSFNGNFIISKSVDGCIIEWMPDFKKDFNTYLTINKYEYFQTELIWFMKFGLYVNDEFSMIGVGNNEGNAYIFRINDNLDNDKLKKDIHKINHCLEVNLKFPVVIRKVVFQERLEYLAFINDRGELIISNFIK